MSDPTEDDVKLPLGRHKLAFGLSHEELEVLPKS